MRKPFLLSLLVALLTTLSTHAYSFQSGDLYYNITSENTVEVVPRVLWSETNYEGITTATIPETVTYDGITYSVTSIGEGAFAKCSNLTTVIIPNSILSLGFCAFEDCNVLISINLPNSVTSIGKYVFQRCYSLTSLTIPNSVTSIGVGAFNNVPNVVYKGSATGSPWDARSVNGYVEGYLVYADETKTNLLACSAAVSGEVTIHNSVTSIGNYAFSYCSSLTSVSLGNSVTSIGDYAFDGCSSLTSVTSLSCTPPSCGSYVFNLTPRKKTLVVPSMDAYKNSSTWKDFTSFEKCLSVFVQSSGSTLGVAKIEQDVDCDSVAIISATANYGYHFKQWNDGNTDNPRTITLTQDTTFTAEFAPNQYTLTTTTNYAERGTAQGDTIADYLSEIQVSATANYGYHFTQWSDGNTDNPRTISLTKDTNVVALFEKNQYQCLINCDNDRGNSFINGLETGNGQRTDIIVNLFDSYGDGWNGCKLTISDGEHTYDCTISSGSNASYEITNYGLPYTFYWTKGSYPSECSFEVICGNTTINISSLDSYNTGDVIPILLPNMMPLYYDYLSELELSITSNYGYHFTQWIDGNTDNPRTITLTKDTTFTAEFAPNQYTLTTTTNYAERGTAQGDTIADYLTEIQVSATANYGYHFTQWSDGNTDNPRTFSLTKDTNLVALFDKNQYTITTYCNADQGTISGTQEAEYLDEVTISATANYGYHFTQWIDGNTDNPRTIKLTQDTTFTAAFAPNQYSLTTTTNYAERGIAQGDTIADYFTELQVSATANYGYHFTQWSDGNIDNPRTISLTKDTNVVALFEKNQYTITTSCNAEQGTISGMQVAEYLDEVTLNVLPNVGWHFTQWTDSNTDNPRTFTLTQDTTFAAEFAMDYSGKCGDELYWAYSNQEIKITGSGAMYNYTDSTMPWTLLRDSILTVRVGNNATSIGEYAFSNTPKLAELHIGTNVENIGANAFSGCRRLYDIYCNPTYPPFAETNSFANYNVYVHVPCASLDAYDVDVVFGSFKYVECIGSEDAVITDKTVTVVPGDADATFTWPVTDNAETYSLVITKDGVTFCTLVFNAQGQLVSIAFKPRRQNAPAVEGTTPATYAEMTANGFRFTVTGLDEGAAYAYTLTVRNAANTVLETYTGDFTTLSSTPTGINESAGEDAHAHGQVEKILRDGQVLILRNGVTYDMMGQTL